MLNLGVKQKEDNNNYNIILGYMESGNNIYDNDSYIFNYDNDSYNINNDNDGYNNIISFFLTSRDI